MLGLSGHHQAPETTTVIKDVALDANLELGYENLTASGSIFFVGFDAGSGEGSVSLDAHLGLMNPNTSTSEFSMSELISFTLSDPLSILDSSLTMKSSMKQSDLSIEMPEPFGAVLANEGAKAQVQIVQVPEEHEFSLSNFSLPTWNVTSNLTELLALSDMDCGTILTLVTGAMDLVKKHLLPESFLDFEIPLVKLTPRQMLDFMDEFLKAIAAVDCDLAGTLGIVEKYIERAIPGLDPDPRCNQTTGFMKEQKCTPAVNGTNGSNATNATCVDVKCPCIGSCALNLTLAATGNITEVVNGTNVTRFDKNLAGGDWAIKLDWAWEPSHSHKVNFQIDLVEMLVNSGWFEEGDAILEFISTFISAGGGFEMEISGPSSDSRCSLICLRLMTLACLL
jgi:hypothetical protein